MEQHLPCSASPSTSCTMWPTTWWTCAASDKAGTVLDGVEIRTSTRLRVSVSHMDRNNTFPIVPAPTKIAENQGPPLKLDAKVSVTTTTAAGQGVANYLADALAEMGISAAALAPGSPPEGTKIALDLTGDEHGPNADGLPGIGAESHQISITDAGAQISASAPAGLPHGATTLTHLLTLAEGTWSLPAVEITDSPRYSWRGFSLDIARSFSPLAEIKEIIDVLVDLKYNVLHLHLCDDQGWRLQIRSHPEFAMTRAGGSKFVPTPN